MSIDAAFAMFVVIVLVSNAATYVLGYRHGRAVWRRGLPPATRRAMDMARKRQSMRIVSDRPEVGARLANVRVVPIRAVNTDDEPTDVGPKPGSAA